MNNIKREYKLSHKLIFSAMVSFFISAMIFLVLTNIAGHLIRVYCTKQEVITVHLDKKSDSLQQYVINNNISLAKISELDKWVNKEELTEVAIYRGNMQLYSSSRAFPKLASHIEDQNDNILWSNGYILEFSDGEAVVFINDLFAHRYTDFATYLNLSIFFLSFIMLMIFFIHKKVEYINTLEQEIRFLEGGDLNYAITIKGNDELASLAREIDEMRKAFIAREEYAGRVTTASNELMTGISHDLRTPLTALIGYLEVMEGEDIPASQSPYMQKCKNRAIQIKSLINNLFEYFFVSASSDVQLEFRRCSIEEGLSEVIKEHIFLMRQSGFVVENRIVLPNATIKIESSIIQRIFDNLLSNIRKYADPVFPIQLESRRETGEFILLIYNHVATASEELESTGLGLKACEKMMLLHQGKLFCQQEKNIYKVWMHFPIS